MNRPSPRVLVTTLIALALYTASWFLPVAELTPFSIVSRPASVGASTVETSRSATNVYYGRDAIRTALAPILTPSAPQSVGDAIGQLLAVASALTHLLFVAACGLLLLAPDRRPSWLLEAAAWVSIALGATWLSGGFAHNVRAGYVLWLLSFVALAIAIRLRRQQGAPVPLGAPLAA
ncbi:MAG TPA: hypothetical protein VFK13_07765 [Gemmatimonadaceae bacterium]|nr:hypothetical protein [Gemmatimonadaceae bacterium]